jgi:release factor glutamine methyltransferase
VGAVTGSSSVGDALGAAVDALTAAGVASPRLDAELLLEEASSLSRAALVASPDAALEPAAARRFAEFVRRRLRREPVAYILGRQGFRHVELTVDRRVLIPRPETELLVEVALQLEPLSVLDVGTGSGAIALAVADELPATTVVATDLYPEALDVASANAARLGLEDRVRFETGSLPGSGSFDLVLANLPYVSARDWLSLEPELRDFEPRGALTPGPTGLEAIEALLGELSVSATVRAAAVALEVGEGQAGIVSELVRRAGFERVEVRPDLAGIDRAVVGRQG